MTDQILRSWPLLTLALTLTVSHVTERVSGLDLALRIDQSFLETLPQIVSSIWSHDGRLHLGANIVGLAAFSMIAVRHASAAKVVAIFVTGGLAGSIAVLATSSLGVGNSNGTRGASAAILAVVAFVLTERSTTRRFDMTWGLALAVIVLAAIPANGLSTEAHLGGALIGFGFGLARPSQHESERLKATD